jgi:ribonucleoside-diphosphate reductase alpha chain
MMNRLEFLPNSPTLMNAGTDLGQLSACFVLPVSDSLDGIFSTLKHAALIQQSGGGTGFNFSHLRPAGDLVRSTSGYTAGPLSFMRVFDSTTSEIRQGGKRRGANMGILNVDHPDIESFIVCKLEGQVMQNFNLSVGASDAFMHAVDDGRSWALKHPVTGRVVKRVKARRIWDLIVHSAWHSGDPGLVFIDEINRHNPTPALGAIEATNPCGEVPLLPYESCNLGSVDLARMIVKGKQASTLDWKGLARTVRDGVRFLDNVIDVNNYLLPEINRMALGNRKIGLGVMGWADLLIDLGIPYDSQRAVRLAGQVMKFIRAHSLEASSRLAEARGTFPNWESSIHSPKAPMRNATVNSIAPTGTISIIADCSSSIEPHFALAWHRRALDGQQLSGIIARLNRIGPSNRLAGRIQEHLEQTGSVAALSELPLPLRRLFKTALEIAPSRHLDHQLAFQRYTDNAVSKTINLSHNAPEVVVQNAFYQAWKGAAKGITIYRDGSKSNQVLYAGAQGSTPCCTTRDSRLQGVRLVPSQADVEK